MITTAILVSLDQLTQNQSMHSKLETIESKIFLVDHSTQFISFYYIPRSALSNHGFSTISIPENRTYYGIVHQFLYHQVELKPKLIMDGGFFVCTNLIWSYSSVCLSRHNSFFTTSRNKMLEKTQ